MNTITLDSQNIGSFLGPIASKYSYTPALRARLDELFRAAASSSNRWFVLDGDTVRAAQSTENGAQTYMRDEYVLVHVDLPLNVIPQGTRVTLKHDIQFPNPFTGKRNLWRAGNAYWVANPEYAQIRDGVIEVCKRNVPMGHGMRFVLALFSEHFQA